MGLQFDTYIQDCSSFYLRILGQLFDCTIIWL